MLNRSIYELAGGEAAFRTMVSRFYAHVEADPVLRPVYPEQDLSDAAEHLTLFLIQYWGGPQTYNELRGHPRLRLRHRPFAIGQEERDAWMTQMAAAVESMNFPGGVRDAMLDYFETAATAMINQPARS